MIHPVWDLFLYLATVQTCLLYLYFSNDEDSVLTTRIWQKLPLIFGVSIVAFWLVWGGYGVDAWRYLGRFDPVPRLREGDPLFWIVGHWLGRILIDPWPLKILAASGAAILIFAYRIGVDSRIKLLQAFILLLCVTGFLLLFGNAVRQGVAGSMVVLAFVLWLGGRRVWTLATAALAVSTHIMSVLPIAAFAGAVMLRRFYLPVFAASYLIYPALHLAFALFDLDLGNYIRYANYDEGDFHFLKVVVAGLLALTAVCSLLRHPSEVLCFRHGYVFLIAACNCLMFYEVPFERALLFADLLLPLAVVETACIEINQRRRRGAVVILFALAGAMIWCSANIMQGIGYI